MKRSIINIPMKNMEIKETHIFLLVLSCLFVLTTAPMRAFNQVEDSLLLQYAPSPKALEMIRYGHLSPDINGGTMNMDIPIYTIDDKDFSLPVSLHYSSNGFQPAKQTGEAGMGWSLMAGGAITREIIGIDDFIAGQGAFAQNIAVDEEDIYSLQDSVRNGNYSPYDYPVFGNLNTETTSDIYRFSMPGHSGSFIIRHDTHDFYVYGAQDGSGTYTVSYNTSTKAFTIKTGDGYEYRFGYSGPNSETAKERNYNRLPKGATETGSNIAESDNPIVTWLLDRIVAPNGRTIHFKYDGNHLYNTVPQTNDDIVTTFGQKHDPASGHWKTVSIVSTSYLKRIVVDSLRNGFPKHSIDFSWSRQEYPEVLSTSNVSYSGLVQPTRKLSCISVKIGNNLVRQATLSYNVISRRPFLNSISIDGIGTYTLAYWLENGTHLPDITTNALDFWGFYNGRTDLNDQAIAPTGVDEYYNEFIQQSYKNPDWTYAKLGMLKSVTYPTGGSTTINYEANRASRIVLRRYGASDLGGLQPAVPELEDEAHFLPYIFSYSLLFPNNDECGGVRVASLTDNDAIGNQSTRSFTYTEESGISSGTVQQFPRYYAGNVSSVPVFNPSLSFPGSSFDTRHIAYDRVTEILPDGSTVVSGFSGWQTEPDIYSPYSVSNGASMGNNSLEQVFLNNILRKPDSRAYRRGLLVSRISKDSSSKTVRTESITYADSSNDYTAYISGSGNRWWTARRFVCDYRPVSEAIVEYDDSGTEAMTTTITFTYDTLGLVSSKTTSTVGGTEVEKYSYSGDMTSGALYNSMQEFNMVSYPVEHLTIRNDKVISAELSEYGQFGTLLLPAFSYSAALGDGVSTSSFTSFNGTQKDSHYSLPETSFAEYNTFGYPTITRDRMDVPTSLKYAADSIHPVAVFHGAYSGIKSSSYSQEEETTEIHQFSGNSSATCNFVSTVAGGFSFVFTGTVSSGTNTDGIISAKLDGVSLSLSIIQISDTQVSCSYMYPHASSLPAGSHTLVLTARGPGLQPFDPLGSQPDTPVNNTPDISGIDDPDITEIISQLGWTMTGTMQMHYAVLATHIINKFCEDVYYEDFEESGASGVGLDGSAGRTTTFTRTMSADTARSYVLGWQKKNGGIWQYNSSTVEPDSLGTLTIVIPASNSSPIDNVILFPSDANAAAFGWDDKWQLIRRSNSRGISEKYAYDAHGRLIGIYDNDGNNVKSFSYGISQQSASQNYIREVTYTSAGGATSFRNVKYYDGLGRPFETVRESAWLSGLSVQGSTAELLEYDALGREYNIWQAAGITGSYISPSSFKTSTISQNIYGDAAPYSTSLYDGPLNRLRSQIGPGQSWRDASKSITYTRSFNSVNNSSALEARTYTVSFLGSTSVSIKKGSLLTACSLRAESITDEDGRNVVVFTNMYNETVLERRVIANGVYSDTYYCRDGAGRLTAVLPPKLTAFMEASSGTTFRSLTVSEVFQYGYFYRYDAKGRMIAKKLPGADWVYYVYDRGNAPVFIQDGNLREDGLWYFSIADYLGRACITGTCEATLATFSDPLGTDIIRAKRSWPSLSANAAYFGYDINGTTLSNVSVLTVNWYDDYSFIGKWDIPSTGAAEFDYGATTYDYGTMYGVSSHALLTGKMTKVLGNTSNDQFLWKDWFYDANGRVVQASGSTQRGGWSKTNTGYKFTGEPDRVRIIHHDGSNNLAERYLYSYDPQMRLLTVSHAICPTAATGGGEPTYQNAVQLHDYRYDFAGRIVSDGRSGNDGLLSRYTYNIRSAHDSIMVGKNLQGVFGATFHEVLRYNTSRSGMQDTPQWSGNIASIDWKAGNTDVMHSYGFVYDAMSRLTGASYSAAGVSTGLYDRTYSYDLNGNIVSITTPSGTTTMNYTGNQLSGVSDAIPFDYPVVEGDFVYDSNGNMTWDASRDYSHGEYNILNLPQSFSTRIGGIAIASNNMLYSADGEKLQRSSTLGVAVTDYTGNLVFKNDSLRTVFFDGGFIAVDYTGGVASYNYRFFVNDHLGNVRVVTDSYGTPLQVNHYDPYGNLLPIVTPSSSSPIVNLSDTGTILAGSSLSDRLFGGKEWQAKAFSYDFGARHFAPGVPRWTSLDPFSEKYYSISPYVYCAGNPINFVDIFGQDFKRTYKKNTIIISATYNVNENNKEDIESAEQAISFWNNRRGDTYTTEDGNVYSIVYRLRTNKTSKIGNFHSNKYELVDKIDNTDKSVDYLVTGRMNDDSNIIIRKDYSLTVPKSKKKSTTGAHEIGHTLGMHHSEKGIMSECQDSNRTDEVLEENIRDMMQSERGYDDIVGSINKIFNRLFK